MHTKVSTQFGFSILNDANRLKLRFDRAGPEGRISLIKACIWSGMTRAEIVRHIWRISGPHIVGSIETMLEEEKDIHWMETSDGELILY